MPSNKVSPAWPEEEQQGAQQGAQSQRASASFPEEAGPTGNPKRPRKSSAVKAREAQAKVRSPSSGSRPSSDTGLPAHGSRRDLAAPAGDSPYKLPRVEKLKAAHGDGRNGGSRQKKSADRRQRKVGDEGGDSHSNRKVASEVAMPKISLAELQHYGSVRDEPPSDRCFMPVKKSDVQRLPHRLQKVDTSLRPTYGGTTEAMRFQQDLKAQLRKSQRQGVSFSGVFSRHTNGEQAEQGLGSKPALTRPVSARMDEEWRERMVLASGLSMPKEADRELHDIPEARSGISHTQGVAWAPGAPGQGKDRHLIPTVSRRAHDVGGSGGVGGLCCPSPMRRLSVMTTRPAMLTRKRHWWLVDPRKHRLALWDCVMVLLILYTMGIVPYEMAFLSYTSFQSYVASPFFLLTRVMDLVYLADMGVSAVTIYFDKEKQVWVSDPRRILRRYLRSFFAVDLITMVPWDMLVFSSATGPNQLLKMLRMFKLLRLYKAQIIFRRFDDHFPIDYSYREIFKYTAFLMIITHWLACAFGFLTNYDHYDINWAKVYIESMEAERVEYGPAGTEGGRNDTRLAVCGSEVPLTSDGCYNPMDLYVASLYWSAMTVTTIGYGDIVPTNLIEQVSVALAMLLGGIVFGWIVGVFAGLISNGDQQQARFREELRCLDALIGEAKIPAGKARDLKNFFKFLNASRTLSMATYQPLLERMSPGLRGHVTHCTDNGWIERLPYFRDVPESFMVELVQALSQQAYPPGETVFHYGGDKTRMYVVKKGVVYHSGKVLMQGACFCEEALYKPGLHGCTAATLTYTYLYTLDREDCSRIVRGYPEIERKLRVLSIRRLFHEEVCSYAYAVHALFNEELLSEADDQAHFSPALRTHFNLEDISPGARDAAAATPKSAAGKRASYPAAGFQHSHALSSPMNAMRVRHYYGKLKLILRTDQDEADAMDRSVILVQRWARGWLARRAAKELRKRREEELDRRLLRGLPQSIEGMAAKLDAVQRHLGVPSTARRAPPSAPQAAAAGGDDVVQARLGWLEARVKEQGEMLHQVLSLLQSRLPPQDPAAEARRQG